MQDPDTIRLNSEALPADPGEPNPQDEKPESIGTAAGQDGTPPGTQEPDHADRGPVQLPTAHDWPADVVLDEVVKPGSEIELKLLVDADRLLDFNEAPVIAENARSRGTRKHLKAVYYDTPERALWRNGLSLRVRQSGAQFVQTVKASGDDPLRRGEWEASVPSIVPDFALATPFIPQRLRSDLKDQALEAVFTADIHRHLRIVDLPSGTVEVAFDHGALRSGDRSVPVSEIELELKGGSSTVLYDLALRLSGHGPVRPSVYSKFERGFDLAADAPPAARKPPKLRLDPSTMLDAAFAAILRACLYHFLQSLPAAEDGRDPEGIHQLRVALRRLRSALDLMRMAGGSTRLEALRSEARWLAQNLSAARDWDIFQGETLPSIAKGCPTVSGFDLLDEAAQRHRSVAYQNARFHLADRRCASFALGLGNFIETRGWRGDIGDLGRLTEPAGDFARRVLSALHAKALKRGRHFKSLGAPDRHRLRLAVKKLRYAVDFLLPLCGQGKSAKRFCVRLSDLQEELGSYNDVATTARLVGGLSGQSPASGLAAAAVAGWQAHALGGAEERLRTIWRDFTKTKVPWLENEQE